MKTFIATILFPQTKKEFLLQFVIFGLCWTLSYPPYNLSFLGWFVLFPIYQLLTSDLTKKKIYGYSYLYLLIAHIFTVFWICFSTFWGGTLAILANPVVLLFSLLLTFAFHFKNSTPLMRVLQFSFFWLFIEYFHSKWELTFPWMMMAHSQFAFSGWLQWVEIGGTWLLSFFAIIPGIFFWGLLTKQFKSPTRVVNYFAIYLLLITIGGWLLYFRPIQEVGKISIGIIQPHVDPWTKWDSASEWDQVVELKKLSADLKKKDSTIQLFIWPETSVSFYLAHDRGKFVTDDLRLFSKQHQVAILTGFPHIQYYDDSLIAPPSARWSNFANKYYHHFNSATLIDGDEKLHVHNKINLVPFAERVPWVDLWPGIKDLRFNLTGLGGWGKGLDTVNFTLKNHSEAIFPSAICYESAFPSLNRIFSKKGATFFTIITNDGWWGNTPGYHQHFQFARLRAIENRVWIARSANNGISGFIDPFGREFQKTDYWTQTAISQSIPLIKTETWYEKLGDVLPFIFLILGLTLPLSRYFISNHSE